jgi:hypothetical protein
MRQLLLLCQVDKLGIADPELSAVVVLLAKVSAADDAPFPPAARDALRELKAQLADAKGRLGSLKVRLL